MYERTFKVNIANILTLGVGFANNISEKKEGEKQTYGNIYRKIKNDQYRKHTIQIK